ncbi:TPA: hypothetical protein ACGOON_001299 [Streptococcus suis]
MTQIAFTHNPNALIVSLTDTIPTAKNTILDYSEQDIIFPILDEWLLQDKDFEFIFGNDILVIPDPRDTLGRSIKAYFNNDMIPTESNGSWFVCFGIIEKNENLIIAGDMTLQHILNAKKHLALKLDNKIIHPKFN